METRRTSFREGSVHSPSKRSTHTHHPTAKENIAKAPGKQKVSKKQKKIANYDQHNQP